MTNTLSSYKELIVWQKAVEVATMTYALTNTFPDVERYGLSSQMQRASVSIASNIAEGYARRTAKDYVHFLHMALGSTYELETQLTIAEAIYPKLQYNEITRGLTEVSKILTVMIRKLAEPKP